MQHPRHPLSALLLSSALFAAACASGAPTPTPTPEPEPEPEPVALAQPSAYVSASLEPYTCGTIEKLHTQGGVFLASQPQPADFEEALAVGIRTVIDLRTPGEVTDFDEPALVTGLGLAYRNFGFRSPETLTDAIFDDARGVLNDPGAHPILMHCASSNRVGAIWLAHRVLDDGLSWEAALEEAHTVGLRTPALEERARQYIDAQR